MVDKYRIGIVGGGAVGLTYAALLSEVSDVVIVTRRKEQAEKINSSGISFGKRDEKPKIYKSVRASTHFKILKNCNAVIIAVKSYDTSQVAPKIDAVIAPDTIVITLQNGLLAFEILKSSISNPHRVLAGVTYVGSSRKDDRTADNGTNFRTYIDSRADTLIKIMKKTDFEVIATDDIKQAIWNKLSLNVAQNALSAVTNKNFREMLESEECLARAEKLLSEFTQVAKLEGVNFDYDPMEKLKDNWRGSSFCPSMWQDLHHGRQTEIDAINGAISKLGKKNNIATPYNDEIVKEIKELENK